MSSSEQIIQTYVTCGECQSRRTTTLNDQSTIDDLHREIRNLCDGYLPPSFSIQYYNKTVQRFIKLNHAQLQGELNPFCLANHKHPLPVVSLYIVADTNDDFENTGQALRIEGRESVSNEQVITTVTNENASIQAQLEQPVTTNNNANLDDNVVCSSGSPLENEFIEDDTNPFEEFLLETGFIQDLRTSDESPISPDSDIFNSLYEDIIQIGQSLPSVHQQLNVPDASTELVEQSDCFYFSLDVKSRQKLIYRSDEFNQTDEAKSNGGITCIQGIKTDAQKMLSIRPKVRIPKRFRNEFGVQLDVYVVTEQLRENKRIFSKHRDQGFLPSDYTRDTVPINPITFDISRDHLTKEGDFELKLPMVTMWNKLKGVEELYELDEKSTIQLHKAAHEPSTSRLLCILREAEQNAFNVICLSGFIRSCKKPPKRHSSLNGPEVHPNTCAPKRMRTA